jgi:hypothetical protein
VFKKEIVNQLLKCQVCESEPNQQVVCLDCYEKKMIELGTAIRSLQREVLELTTSVNLLRAIGESAVSKLRESNSPPDSGKIAELVNLLKDQQP